MKQGARPGSGDMSDSSSPANQARRGSGHEPGLLLVATGDTGLRAHDAQCLKPVMGGHGADLVTNYAQTSAPKCTKSNINIYHNINTIFGSSVVARQQSDDRQRARSFGPNVRSTNCNKSVDYMNRARDKEHVALRENLKMRRLNVEPTRPKRNGRVRTRKDLYGTRRGPDLDKTPNRGTVHVNGPVLQSSRTGISLQSARMAITMALVLESPMTTPTQTSGALQKNGMAPR